MELVTLEEPQVKTEDFIGAYHKGISNNDYHGMKNFFSSSQVKEAIESAATFRWYLENGKKNDSSFETSKINKMNFGTLVHALTLEPHLVEEEFLWLDCIGKNFRTKDGKEYKAKMLSKAEKENKIPMQAHALEIANKCVKSVKNHKFASKLLFELDGAPEMSGFFHDKDFGLDLRFRPDRFVYDLDGMPAIVDIKTTESMEDFFKKANFTFKYDLSAYMYLRGNLHLSGEWIDFYFVVIESEAPYRTAVYKASEKFLDFGKYKFERAMRNIQEALEVPYREEVFQATNWEWI